MESRATLGRLYIVRHGETAWSLSGQHTSRTEILLTDRGKQQARTLGDRLRRWTFAAIFTSPRERARQTCDEIGWTSGVEIEPDLAEWDYGNYEGLRSVDIHEARPDWNLFHDGCPGGEGPDDVGARADRLLARVRTIDGDVAVCTHGHFGRVLGARWAGLSAAHAQHLLLDTASLSILGYDHHRRDQPAIALWNDTGW